ncbi:MAG TPA: alpha/beta fold hydrolase [Bacillales bacterium]|nr:alpha/beta fold hydrolase [Bacillales bacterium]
MKLIRPKPFTYHAGNHGVLLLHGFAGTSAHVRKLGRFLQENGFTCHAPIYDGHGLPPDQLLQSRASDWWRNAVQGYREIQSLVEGGVAVIGLSLGGVLSLKLAYSFPVRAVATMCSPIAAKSRERLLEDVMNYGREYKKLENKTPEQIEAELTALKKLPLLPFEGIHELYSEVYGHLEDIRAPLLVIQAAHDEVIDPKSAEIIYERVQSEEKSLHWYDHSPHVITNGEEKDRLHEDILRFLQDRNWGD